MCHDTMKKLVNELSNMFKLEFVTNNKIDSIRRLLNFKKIETNRKNLKNRC